MNYDRKQYTDAQLIHLYKELLWPRMIEEKMLVLLRQGKISKWFSGIGQEAISVGATQAMQPNEWVMPLHRNLGVFTSRGMPLHKLYKQWQGSQDGYSKGRERSFHFGSKAHYICGMISHLGPQLAVAAGAALAYKLCNTTPYSAGSTEHTTEHYNHTNTVANSAVTLAFTGDGGTSEGDFHEALNVAAVWQLPVIFIIENNGYGLSTPTSEQYACEQLVQRAAGYGIQGVRIDGNNILEVYNSIQGVRAYCHTHSKPYLIECMTFRMRGHEEASGVKYVPPELIAQWQLKDPITNYEQYLTQLGVITADAIAHIKHEYTLTIESELAIGNNSPAIVVHTQAELQDVYHPYTQPNDVICSTAPHTTLKYYEAIKQAMHQALALDAKLILMGQDVAEYGGAFKLTEGFVEIFGKHRIRNTPICESAIVGIALGLSLQGYTSIMEMQFADFATVGFNQIVNNLAKLHYRWGQAASVVIRMPTGGGVGAGPFHSQSNEAWFTKVPGLIVVYPSNPYDAKGLLLAAIANPNPVLYFEHKALYRSITGNVPNAYYQVPIGIANPIQVGTHISIITYGQGVHWAIAQAQAMPHISMYILDLRSLAPIDYDAVILAVKQTGKVLLLTEDTTIGSIASELSAYITEHCFEYLDAPIIRCGSLETPIPFNTALEQNYMASARLQQAIEQLHNY